VLSHSLCRSTLTSDTVDLPNLYKKSIIFFRSLHSFVRLLPTHQLRDRLKGSDSGITLGYRLRKNNVQRFDEISYGEPLLCARRICIKARN
jgi:hypothetical protein